MKKYKLFECGLGDIIIFLSYLKQFHENQTVLFDFNKECIKTYRESDDTYYDLIVDFSKLLLSDSNIHNIKYSNFEDIDYHMISINDIIPNYQYHSENFKYIQSVNNFIQGFGGQIWPSRLIGFGVGVIVFTTLSHYIFKEPLDLKNAICLFLGFTIVLVQLFVK